MNIRKATRHAHALFVIEGDCQRPLAFGPMELSEVHPNYQVDDLSTVDERLAGKGVRLRKLIDMAGPGYGTAWLTIESLQGGFRGCLPLAEISRTAIVVYEQGGKALAVEDGGPARLVIPFSREACADVPALARLIISREPVLATARTAF